VGARQEVDFTHAAFLFHAERIIRAVVGRYANHPAVIGIQVDNEPGLELLHNRGVFESFVDHLRHSYGDVETLNDAWGLTYWSHRLSTWADLWTPDGNAQPQYDLAWRRFQAQLTTDFIAWQAGIVRELARPDQFVTTCIAYSRPAVDDRALTAALDVTAGNPYYAMQDSLALPDRSVAPQGWTTAGTWSIFQSADRMYSSRQEPFLVTETNAGAIGGPAMNFPAYDGQWRQVAWAMVARGARMIEYWHWHTLHFGTETYWVGVLPHDQVPGRVYKQLSVLGAELRTAGEVVAGLIPDAQVGLLYSNASNWGLTAQPAFSDGAEPVKDSYGRIVEAFYRGAFDAGLGVRLLHDTQVVADGSDDTDLMDPAEIARELPVLLVPALYIASNRLLDWLRRYAAEGGHLVLGPRSAYADEEARARVEVKPSLLAEAAGVSYQEFANLSAPVPVKSVDPCVEVPAGACGTGWLDCLVPNGADVLVGYDDPFAGAWPAVVTAGYGKGRITTVGTVPDAALSHALSDWLLPVGDDVWRAVATGALSVTHSSATSAEGTRVRFLHNWAWEPVDIVLPVATRDVLSGDTIARGQAVTLGPWDVRVLIEEHE